MTSHSIRVRLTAWYVGVLALALAALALGSWAILRKSVVDAADASLEARIAGVRRLIESMERELPPGEVVDEFREFAELTAGETLLEVTDATGFVYCAPSLPGWSAVRLVDRTADSGTPRFVDRVAGGAPYRVTAATVAGHAHEYHVVAAISMKPAADFVRRMGAILAWLLPAILALAAAGGYWISGRALAPVDRMTRAAQAITLRHLDRRLDVPAADDELRRLAATFNDMLARLQVSVADMVRFTAEASHELRTPVSLVRATAEVALGRDRPAADYRQALAEILEHAERMSSLVNDLLALARADAGVEPQETGPVDIAAIAVDAGRHMQAAMAQKGQVFHLAVPGAPVIAVGHAESLRRLVLILLDNAVKYTPAGGRIEVAVASAATGGARVTVTDTGVGIGAAERPHVFDRFYRGAAARQAAADGSGLGLSIAKTIVERHGGRIAIGDGPAGIGSAVEVVFGS